MRITRLLATASVAVALALAVTACSSGGGAGTTPKATADSNPYKVITPGVLLASTSGSQPPFTMAQSSGEPTGFVVDLTNDIAKRLHLKVEYKTTTVPAGIQALTANQYDIVVDGLGVTPEREKSISFAKGVYWSTTAALTKKDNASISSMDGLAGNHVAVITGSVQVAYLQQIKGAVAVDFADQNSAVSALNSGTVDAFLLGGPDADQYLKQFPQLKVAASQPVDHPTTVAFQKDNTALVTAYNTQLAAMVKDGTFMKLYKKYFVEKPAAELVKIWPGLNG